MPTRVSILGEAISLEISKPTLRTDQKGNRVAQALIETQVISLQVNGIQARNAWNFSAMLGRLVDVTITPDALESEEVQEFAKWVETWRELNFDSNYLIHDLFQAYLDLHSDIVNAWIEADKTIAKDLVIARREQLPESSLNNEELGELAQADSPLA